MGLLWLLRVIVVGAALLFGYFQTAPEIHGALVGGLLALGIVVFDLVLTKVSLAAVILAVLGSLVGLAFGNLIGVLVRDTQSSGALAFWANHVLLVKGLLAYLGAAVMARHLPEIRAGESRLLSKLFAAPSENLYVVDVSALIDGRIQDALKTRFFVNASFVVSKFLVEELQRLSEDADNQKRTRGQRALKVLSGIQEESYVSVRVVENDYQETQDINEKCLKLAKDLKARLITTEADAFKSNPADANFILNLNDLYAALKPAVLPGEAIHVYLIKEGKEREQGVGYLDDGTMVVVDGGRGFIGRRVEVAVSSVLQTAAGKMVFSKVRNHHRE